MNYENFVYELIRLLMNWGTWKDSVQIIYDNKKYAPCRTLESTTDKENHAFRDLKNVVITDLSKEDKDFCENWPNNCEISVELNSPLCDLFAFGAFTTDLSDLPLFRRIEVYRNSKELQEEFREYGMESSENEFIEDLSGPITFDNDPEGEICALCVEHGLSYPDVDAYLFIGHNFF